MNRTPHIQVALALIILISLTVSLTPQASVQATPASGGCWYYKTYMPAARSASAAVTIDNEIYVMGGAEEEILYSDLLEKYVPSTDSWETLAPMPTPRDLLVAAIKDHALLDRG